MRETKNNPKLTLRSKPYLDIGAFRRLREHITFAGAQVVSGSVEWPGKIDLSYDTLYLEGRPVESKLRINQFMELK